MMQQSRWTMIIVTIGILLLGTTLLLSCGSGGQTDDAGQSPGSDDSNGSGDSDTSDDSDSDSGTEAENTYFPISVWLQQARLAEQYKALGINLYIGLWEGPTEAQLEALQDVDMTVICSQNEFALQNLDRYGETIVGWMHGDEPDNAQWNDETGSYDPCIEPSVIVADYDAWKTNDATHPVYLNFGQGVANVDWIGRGDCTGRTDMYPDYIEGSDIVSFDIYPVTSGKENVQGNLWYVAEGVKNLRLWSNAEKPVWCWIETTHISSTTHKPTPSQVKTEVWMALIHGAGGIGYFCHEWYPDFNDHALLGDTEMAHAVTLINAEITELAPVLNSPELDEDLLTETTNDVPVAATYRSRQNHYYIFAVNMRDEAATATFNISSVSTAGRVEVLYEDRTIEADDGLFQDEFSGYAVHRYRFTVQ
jgi:hypothetical protein